MLSGTPVRRALPFAAGLSLCAAFCLAASGGAWAAESIADRGPHFEEGGAVLGEVYNDLDQNGKRDPGEPGVAGVKVVSDTGIVGITDEEGKYHYPYIETGQRALKLDPDTLSDKGFYTTDPARNITVTRGLLSKVSFGVWLEEEVERLEDADSEGPYLKVGITQEPAKIDPVLEVRSEISGNAAVFTINCNYTLFIEGAVLTIYDKDLGEVTAIPLPSPLPRTHIVPFEELRLQEGNYYYQLRAYDRDGASDRTSLGKLKIPDWSEQTASESVVE